MLSEIDQSLDCSATMDYPSDPDVIDENRNTNFTFDKDSLHKEFVADFTSFATQHEITPQRAIIFLIKSGKTHKDLTSSDLKLLMKPATELLDLTWQFSNLIQSGTDLCQICYCSDGPFRQLECGDAFCSSCWKSYVETEISNKTIFIRCPGFNEVGKSCCYCLTLEQIKSASDDNMFEMYMNVLLDDFVSRSLHIDSCPSCGKYVKLTPNVFNVKCECSHRFCPKCKAATHEPIRCDLVEVTLKSKNISVKSDMESLKYIVENTKYCPKCKTPVQKTEGCNFMSCTCRAHFCFGCLTLLATSHQHHTCNTFDKPHIVAPTLTKLQESMKEEEKIKQTRDKFYASHAEVAEVLKFDETLKRTAEKLSKLYDADMTREELNLLMRCSNALVNVLSFLAYSRVWLDFVSDQGDLDEFYIKDCEKICSDLKRKFLNTLSGETVPKALLPQVRDGTAILETRLESLRSHLKDKY